MHPTPWQLKLRLKEALAEHYGSRGQRGWKTLTGVSLESYAPKNLPRLLVIKDSLIPCFSWYNTASRRLHYDVCCEMLRSRTDRDCSQPSCGRAKIN